MLNETLAHQYMVHHVAKICLRLSMLETSLPRKDDILALKGHQIGNTIF